MMPEEAVRFSFTGCLTAEVYRRALYVRLRKLRRVYAALAAAVVPLGILTRNIVCLCAGGAAVWSHRLAGGSIPEDRSPSAKSPLYDCVYRHRSGIADKIGGKHGCCMSCSTG